jgi:hypothetical protein
VGIREPRHGLLGAAESLRRPLGNYAHSTDSRDIVTQTKCAAKAK